MESNQLGNYISSNNIVLSIDGIVIEVGGDYKVSIYSWEDLEWKHGK